MIRNGVQAVLMCNRLHTSARTLQQVFDWELAYLNDKKVGTAAGGDYAVNDARKAVPVGLHTRSRKPPALYLCQSQH
jgi:hypothetical protein